MGTVHILPPLGAAPCPPFVDPLLIDDRGNVWNPHPFHPDLRVMMPLCEGLALGWAPLCSQHILLSLWGGNDGNPTDEAIALTITREGLRLMIADLQSIDRQMEAQS